MRYVRSYWALKREAIVLCAVCIYLWSWLRFDLGAYSSVSSISMRWSWWSWWSCWSVPSPRVPKLGSLPIYWCVGGGVWHSFSISRAIEIDDVCFRVQFARSQWRSCVRPPRHHDDDDDDNDDSITAQYIYAKGMRATFRRQRVPAMSLCDELERGGQDALLCT